MIDLNQKTILVTGGTGSFGKDFVCRILKDYNVKKIIIFSRDELKQYHMQKELDNPKLRFFLGDVRDLTRLRRSFCGVDIVIHAAALKQVPALEYNPMEAVNTNIIGTQNVIEAAIDRGVSKVLLISTDKAAHPSNLYGSTKLCAEKLCISANSYGGDRTYFAVVRYGNVIGSRGSIVETLLRLVKESGTVEITHEDMTRFWINLSETYQLVLFALDHMVGGEIFVPQIPSMKLVDLIDAIAPENERNIVGIRPGEKMHEILITEQEARHTRDFMGHYVVMPEFPFWEPSAYQKYYQTGTALNSYESFVSVDNNKWITKEELQKIMGLQ